MVGILSTPNIGLLYPDDNNLFNEHQLIAPNMDKLDELIGDYGPNTYIPTLRSEPGVGTQPNVGSDAVPEGLWYRVLDFVVVHAKIKWGTTGVDPGSGNNSYLMSLPVPVAGLVTDDVSDIGRGSVIGSAILESGTSTTRQTAAIYPRTGSDEVYFLTEAGETSTVVRFDVPFTWSASDMIAFTARYRGSFE